MEAWFLLTYKYLLGQAEVKLLEHKRYDAALSKTRDRPLRNEIMQMLDECCNGDSKDKIDNL